MAVKVMKTVSDKLLLGRCLPCLIEDAVKVKVPTLELDERLLMYFKKYSMFYAYDPQKLCKTGDMILIKKLPNVIKRVMTHEVLEVVYPLGDVVDPVTGEKCVNLMPRAALEAEQNVLGKRESSFNYSKAPKRGWQEGKRDFTDRQVYTKYHEFSEGDEEYNDPYCV